jgi:hypothetical protein
VPEIAGTIPAVRERPKVTRRPTIIGPAAPPKKPLAKKRAVTKPDKPAALAGPIAQEKTPPAEKGTGPKPDRRPTTTASTIPLKKPLVKRKAEPKRDTLRTMTAPTIPEKKPLITKQAKAAAAVSSEPTRAVSWLRWLPIAVGIAIASVAPQIHALAALWNPWGLRVIFPFVQLTGLHEIGMSDELTRTVPQLMLYMQFPLEGLLVASNLRRGMRLTAAVGPIPALHFVAGLVLWIVALGSVRPN